MNSALHYSVYSERERLWTGDNDDTTTTSNTICSNTNPHGKHYIITKLLLDYGININNINNNGQTALHRCISKYDRIDVIKLLIKYNININIIDNNNNTAIMIAKNNNYDYIIQLFEPKKQSMIMIMMMIIIPIVIVLIAILLVYIYKDQVLY